MFTDHATSGSIANSDSFLVRRSGLAFRARPVGIVHPDRLSGIRPRPCYQDIDEAFGAGLPGRIRGNIGDADQRSQQIDRVDIRAHLAVFDGSTHQLPDRRLHMLARVAPRFNARSVSASRRPS